MLTESSPSLRKAALVRLFNVVDTQWHEVAQSLPDLEALAEDVEEDLEVRQLAAKVASRVFFYLEEPEQALRLALESGEGVFDESSNKSKAYVECLVGAAVDTYIVIKQKSNDGDEKSEEDAALPIDKLQTIVQIMFDRCFSEQKFEHALGIALEAREEAKVMEIFVKCGEQGDASKLNSLLQYAFHAATTLVSSKVFRFQVVQIIAQHLTQMMEDNNVPNAIQKSCAFSLANAHQVLRTSKPVANIISKLLNGTDDDALLGLQLCFDLVESGDQTFVNSVSSDLKSETENEASSDNFEKAFKVLVGGFSSELAIAFLHKSSDSDPLIMENLKSALEQRGSGRNSVLHNCAVMAHSFLNAGTTNDAFLRDNLEWMKKASNWAKFSATGSLGVLHAGHITEAMTLLEPYLPADPEGENAVVTSEGGYAEGGSLYALGLIHGSHAGSSAEKRSETNDFLMKHLRNSHANEPISHGAALGVGLTALGTNKLDVVNELKDLIYTDSAVSGEAAGIAIGLVLVGSGAGNVRNNLDPNEAEEINEVISELKTYAKETQHEKIIRGIVMGMALINYGQEENADYAIDEMRGDRDPLMRYGAQYALALAYCGTGSNKAVRLLLHTAVSDVSDDVRMAAVIGLAFVLYKTPKRVPELVKLLLESFNPHVRYASCMAVGIAMAGSGDAESVALLEPMLKDMTDFVRQGALLGTSFIYMQQSDQCNDKKIKSFREKIASIVSDKHQTTLTKMGAIMATGILDAGGRNCSFDLGSKNGFTKMTSAIGAALWLQHWYWFPMMHMFSLAITPTFTIGLNKDFKYPKSFEIKCNSKPSLFACPKRLEEKKEEKKKRVETVTLSTTAKEKARLARKKAKEDGDEVMEEETPEVKEEVKDEPMDESKEEATEEKKQKKKREPEPLSYRLSNPCRITKAQAEYCEFDLEQRYRPIRTEEKPYGVILVTDSTPGEDEDLGVVKPPSIESEDEADPPEPFEWTPPEETTAAKEEEPQASSE
jgi:26S proteasome regulatory subunit N2